MSLRGYDDIVECPYNKAHQILKHRFQTHLVKCRKNYPNMKKVPCFFNSTHLVNETELSYHMKDCPDKGNFDRYKCNINTNSNVKIEPASSSALPKAAAPPPLPPPTEFDDEENWDDMNHPTYNPREYAENAPIIRTFNLGTPSQRSAFREAEIKRLNQVNIKKEKN